MENTEFKIQISKKRFCASTKHMLCKFGIRVFLHIYFLHYIEFCIKASFKLRKYVYETTIPFPFKKKLKKWKVV